MAGALNVSGAATISGLTVQNLSTMAGALNVSGAATISGLTVQNLSTMFGFTSLSGAGQAGSATLNAAGNVAVANTSIRATSVVVTTPIAVPMPNVFVILNASTGFTISGGSNAGVVNYFIPKY
jgi:hypothetical protein